MSAHALGSEALAPFGATTPKHVATSGSRHARPEAVDTLTLQLFRLISPFHDT